MKHLLLLVLLLKAVSGCASASSDATENHALRSLVLMTDGVPYVIIDSLYGAGHFAQFHAPSQLVSPFPSLTGVAFRDIWQEELSPGYEDLYYDTEENRIAGGLLDHVFRPAEHVGFHRRVEVEANALTTGLAYLTPGPMSQLELRAVRKRIAERAPYDSTIVAYIVTTDAIAHRADREDLVAYVLQIEDMVDELVARYPGLRVSLFSDHGNDFVTTKRVPLEEAVRAAGLTPAKQIEAGGDVVLPRFGLVGSAFLYGSPHAEPRLAQALRGVEGVDLVLFEDQLARIHVWNAAGEAVVESADDGSWYRYVPMRGDPLGLEPALRRMQREGTADATGAAPDAAWLEASKETLYIDALRRITTGMRSSVANPASVVVSFAPGYHFGDVAADAFVTVRGTHGSLRTSSSLAYFMTTHTPAPPLVRSDRLLQYLGRGL